MEIRQIKSLVRVNQISPGLVATSFQQHCSTEKQYLDAMTERHKTALTVENLVEAVLFCLKASPYCQVSDILMKPTLG